MQNESCIAHNIFDTTLSKITNEEQDCDEGHRLLFAIVPSSLTALLDSVVLDLYEQRLQQSGEIDLGNGRAYEGNLSKQIVSRFAHICNKIVFLPRQSWPQHRALFNRRELTAFFGNDSGTLEK